MVAGCVIAAALVMAGCAKPPAELTAEEWLARIPAPQGLSDQEYKARARQFARDFVGGKYFEAMHEPWVPASCDPFGEMVPNFGPYGPSTEWLYPDGCPASIFMESWTGAAFEGEPFLAKVQWYPSGRPMLIERRQGLKLVEGRYYRPDGRLLGRVNKGSGVAYEMLADPVNPGFVTATRHYADGLPVGPEPEHNEPHPREDFRDVHDCHWPTKPDTGDAACPEEEPPRTFPGLAVIHDYGKGATIWAVRPADNAVLTTKDDGRTWQVIHKVRGYQPRQVFVTDRDEVFIWGWLGADQPERGIPARVEWSRDGGTTWQTAAAPGSYMLGLHVDSDGLIHANCKLLPSGGLGKGQHWWFLNSWWFTTQDGRHWIRRYEWQGDGVKDRSYASPNSGTVVHVRTAWFYKGALKVTSAFLCQSLAREPICLGTWYGADVDVRWTPDGKHIIVADATGKTNRQYDASTGSEVTSQPDR